MMLFLFNVQLRNKYDDDDDIEGLNDLTNQNSVSLTWVPAHAGIQVNERADKLARQAKSTLVDGAELFVGWVDPRVGLGWVGNGLKICVLVSWVGSWV